MIVNNKIKNFHDSTFMPNYTFEWGVFMSFFTDKLKSEIKHRGVTQKVFLTDMGLNINAIGDWVKRGNIPSGDILQKIADYFGVTTDWLTGKSQFRTQQEFVQGLDSWKIPVNENYDLPYDFCGFLRELREETNVSVEELAKEIGLTSKQYKLCEDGLDPITQEQAEKLCSFFGTTLKQLLFDCCIYVPDKPVPEEYLDDIEAWEKMVAAAEEKTLKESAMGYILDIQTSKNEDNPSPIINEREVLKQKLQMLSIESLEEIDRFMDYLLWKESQEQ